MICSEASTGGPALATLLPDNGSQSMNVGFKIPNRVDAEPPDRTFDLRQYLNFVWRNWMFIASVTALAFLVGVIYLVRATPLYTATTQVLLEQREKAPSLDAVVNRSGHRQLFVSGNQLAILRSDSLLRRVVIKELARTLQANHRTAGADVKTIRQSAEDSPS